MNHNCPECDENIVLKNIWKKNKLWIWYWNREKCPFCEEPIAIDKFPKEDSFNNVFYIIAGVTWFCWVVLAVLPLLKVVPIIVLMAIISHKIKITFQNKYYKDWQRYAKTNL